MRHEDEASQVWPFLDEFFEALHHPAGEPAPLELLKDKDVGEIGKCDVVGHDASKAHELYVGSVWPSRRSACYLPPVSLSSNSEFGERILHRDDKKENKRKWEKK